MADPFPPMPRDVAHSVRNKDRVYDLTARFVEAMLANPATADNELSVKEIVDHAHSLACKVVEKCP